MKFTAKSEYALRAMAYLAVFGVDQRVRAEEIAQSTAIPRQFLENILGEMRRGGLLHTRRGADGGYELARAPETISLHDVLAAIESSLTREPGLSQDGDVVAEFLRRVEHGTEHLLRVTTLADLAAGHLPSAAH